MQKVTKSEPNTPNSCEVLRKINMDRIRKSMRNITVISQNQRLTQEVLLKKNQSTPENTPTSCSLSDKEEIESVVEHFELFGEKYELMEKLGEGTNGVVHKCKRRDNNKEYAVKSFRFDD